MDDAMEPGNDIATDAVPDSAAADASGKEEEDGAAEDTALLRELVLRAHPDVVPELLLGETVTEMLASVPAARAAYQRIAQAQSQPAQTNPVPGGGTIRTTSVNAEGMSAMAKIRTALDKTMRHHR